MRHMSTEAKETLTEAVQERLIDDIVSGVLEPGQNLRIEVLKDQYEVGASPLREALSRLTSLGFVTNETRRGFRVAPMSEADLADLTRLRQIVEAEALQESIALHDPLWEMELAGSFAKLSLAATRQYGDPIVARRMIEAAHRQFHRALVGACRSPRILSLQEVLYDQASRYRHLIVDTAQTLDGFIESHNVLMNAALGPDVNVALRALHDHIAITPRVVYGRDARTAAVSETVAMDDLR
jgi:GntR family transcriptional regulator, carbon starvation induced regulator